MKRLALGFAAVALAIAGCASSPPPRTDTLNAYLQQVGDSGILPSPRREVRMMECVLWVNTTRDKPITIRLKKQCPGEVKCLTTWNFKNTVGEMTDTGLLPPGGAASICFHSAGTFEYEVQGLDRPTKGTIVVRDEGPGSAKASGHDHGAW
jgi:hypothetical protein